MNQALILQGISGSGKSTYVENFTKQTIQDFYQNRRTGFPTIKSFSADNFFTKDGIYKYDKTKQSEAHAECLRDYIRFLFDTWVEDDYDRIAIVDNTNCTYNEMSAYIQIAKAYDFEPKVITFVTDPKIHGVRNIHNVPQEVIEIMQSKINNCIVPHYIKRVFVNAEDKDNDSFLSR